VRFVSRIRLPNFKVACALCVVALLAVACWAFVDASFADFMTDGPEMSVGILETDFQPFWWMQYRPFMSRLYLALGMAMVWTLGMSVIASRLIRGSENDRSVRALFGAVTIVGLTCGALLGAKKLNSVGRPMRVTWALNDFKEDFAILRNRWPTEPGVLPHAGEFHLDMIDSEPLFFDRAHHLIKETCGGLMLPLEGGGIACELRKNLELFIEFHPDGRKPVAHEFFFNWDHMDIGVRLVPTGSRELEPNWFLVTYRHQLIVNGSPVAQ
jgi:hypothetical protein